MKNYLSSHSRTESLAYWNGDPMAEPISRTGPDALITGTVLQNNAEKAAEGQNIRFLGGILECFPLFYANSFDSSMSCTSLVVTRCAVGVYMIYVDFTPSESGHEVRALQIVCSRKLQQYYLNGSQVLISLHQGERIFSCAGYSGSWEGYN